MKLIDLKIFPSYFRDVLGGDKTFEIRKNDRDYEVGDLLVLHEYDPDSEAYTGETLAVTVKYVFSDEKYVLPGYVVLGIEKCDMNTQYICKVRNKYIFGGEKNERVQQKAP